MAIPKKQIKKNGLTPRPLKINMKDAVMEGNLIDLPFVQYEKSKEPITAVEYNWLDSDGNARTLSVRGSAMYGLPTEYEYDVLVALFRLYVKQQELLYGQNLKSDEDIPVESLKVNFTLNELLKEMGYASSGASCERVQQAIEVLRDTVIYGSLYDKGNKEYLTQTTKSFNIISEYQSLKHIKDKSQEEYYMLKNWTSVKDGTFVVINPFFVRSLSNSYFKFFDYEGYLSIGKSGIAKKLYLLFSKWRGDKNVLEVKLQTLYDRIPISKEVANYRKKEKIKRACERLKSRGLIKDYSLEKDRVKIEYVSKVAIQIEDRNKLAKYTTYKQVKARLYEMGYTPEEFEDRENVIVMLIKDVMALLRYIDDQQQKVKIKNPKAYVENYLERPYTIPEKYYLTGGFQD